MLSLNQMSDCEEMFHAKINKSLFNDRNIVRICLLKFKLCDITYNTRKKNISREFKIQRKHAIKILFLNMIYRFMAFTKKVVWHFGLYCRPVIKALLNIHHKHNVIYQIWQAEWVCILSETFISDTASNDRNIYYYLKYSYFHGVIYVHMFKGLEIVSKYIILLLLFI